MKILLVADGRSPTTHSWIECIRGFSEVELVSTFDCTPIAGVAHMQVLPMAWGGLAGAQAGGAQASGAQASGAQASGGSGQKQGLRRILNANRKLAMQLRNWITPALLDKPQRELVEIVRKSQPDLVHALRIPFEGMIASRLPGELPLCISTWGNDLTFHAKSSPGMATATRRTLQRAAGLMTDTQRDARLALEWGLAEGAQRLVVPGSGGLDLIRISAQQARALDLARWEIAEGARLVVNPRGFRPGSVLQDVFFASVPSVAREFPEVVFVCPGMRGQAEAEQALEKWDIHKNVRLLPRLEQEELWQLFNQAELLVSLSAHDGTPNSLLEGMACALFPIAGDIESIREWITPGVNGLLVPPDSADAAADAIKAALRNPELRRRAAGVNANLIRGKADREYFKPQIEQFYRVMLGK